MLPGICNNMSATLAHAEGTRRRTKPQIGGHKEEAAQPHTTRHPVRGTHAVLRVWPRRSLCRAPALSRCLCRASALYRSCRSPALCRGPALSVSGPGALCVSGPGALPPLSVSGPDALCVGVGPWPGGLCARLIRFREPRVHPHVTRPVRGPHSDPCHPSGPQGPAQIVVPTIRSSSDLRATLNPLRVVPFIRFYTPPAPISVPNIHPRRPAAPATHPGERGTPAPSHPVRRAPRGTYPPSSDLQGRAANAQLSSGARATSFRSA